MCFGLVFFFSLSYSWVFCYRFVLFCFVSCHRSGYLLGDLDNSGQISLKQANAFFFRIFFVISAVVKGNYRFCKYFTAWTWIQHTHTHPRLLNMVCELFSMAHSTVELHLIMDTCRITDSHTCSNTLITRSPKQKMNQKKEREREVTAKKKSEYIATKEKKCAHLHTKKK